MAIPFYTGSGLGELITWSSLFGTGAINFLIPLLLFIFSERTRRQQVARTGIHNNTGTIQVGDSAEYEQAYRALPCLSRDSKIPVYVAWALFVLVASLNVFVIGLAFYSLATSQDHYTSGESAHGGCYA